MSIKRSSRVLVATFVVASLTASPALAISPDAADISARHQARTAVDKRSPDAQDAARLPGSTPRDLRVTSSLAGSPRAVKPEPTPPVFPTNTTPLPPPAVPVSSSPSGDGFDWTDAAIGAGGAAVIVVSLAGGVALTRRRRVATA
jgi:hypothetical protein